MKESNLKFSSGIPSLDQTLQGILAGDTLAQLSGVGGILLMGVGINLLEIKKINVVNLLPSLLVVLAVKMLLP